MRTAVLFLLCTGPLLATELPRNQVPHPQKAAANADHAELDRLRATIRAQQMRLEGLQTEVARLNRDVERLTSDGASQQERIGKLEADLARGRSEAEELRSQIAALGREAARRKGDRKELVGTWKVVSVEEDGAPRPKAVERLSFGAGSVTFQAAQPGRERVYAYQLEPAEEPKEIDVFGGGVRPTRGIYDLKGDRLTLCIDQTLTDRPTEFLSRPGSGTALWFLERETKAASR